MHCLIGKEALKDQEAPLAILAWSSHKIRRVCRSTLSAEARGLCIGLEGADYLKVVLAETRSSSFALERYREALMQVEGVAIIDARSVYDYVTRDSGKLPGDKRLGIDLRLLQHYLQGSSYVLRWVAGAQQLADCLTKEADDLRYFHWVARRGKYQLIRDGKLDARVENTLHDWQHQILDEADLVYEKQVESSPQQPARKNLSPEEQARKEERNHRKGESARRRRQLIHDLTIDNLEKRGKDSALLAHNGVDRSMLMALQSIRRSMDRIVTKRGEEYVFWRPLPAAIGPRGQRGVRRKNFRDHFFQHMRAFVPGRCSG